MSFFTKNDIVEMAVRMEQNGFAFYDKALQRKDLDVQTEAILSKLRDDEEQHEKTFLSLRNKIDELDMSENAGWEESQYYMETIVETHVFSDSKKAIQLAMQAKDSAELLQYAIKFEKDTILFFFTVLKHVKGQKAEKTINAIINEEATHIRKLRELL